MNCKLLFISTLLYAGISYAKSNTRIYDCEVKIEFSVIHQQPDLKFHKDFSLNFEKNEGEKNPISTFQLDYEGKRERFAIQGEVLEEKKSLQLSLKSIKEAENGETLIRTRAMREIPLTQKNGEMTYNIKTNKNLSTTNLILNCQIREKDKHQPKY